MPASKSPSSSRSEGEGAAVATPKATSSATAPNIFGSDPWKTLYRPLPEDVYRAVKDLEDLVGVEIGNLSSENRSMGHSVAIWTIITQFLIENSEALRAKAKEWI